MATSRLATQHDLIVTLLTKGWTKQAIADHLHVSRSTLRDYIRSNVPAEIAEPKIEPVLVDDTPTVSREAILEHKLREATAKVRAVHTVGVQFEMLLEEIRAGVSAKPVEFEPAELAPIEAEDLHPHVQAALLSDLHGGETVRAVEVNNLNEYNWEIMQERVANWRRKLLLYKQYRPFGVEELQLWFLGDMCGGAHHQELAVSNDHSEAEQAVKMGLLLGDLVESLVPEYPKITVYEVPGNHGRVPMKPASKRVFNNFDWIAYRIGEQRVANYESVTWHPNYSNFQIAEIAGLKVLLFHGDGIRSTMPGVPWGGVMRRVAQLKAQYAEQGILLDGFSLGHFHQANAVQNIWMNGSVKGVDDWVLKQFGAGEAPTQLLLWFDPVKQRRTDVSYINP